ncbi:MAG: ABC transporter ATP-binding protein [Alphaproteobacteria bacterium]
MSKSPAPQASTAANTSAKMSLRNIGKHFGEKAVLEGLNLDVAKGQTLVIIGGSGSGKSVLLKCILGLIQPDTGSVMIDGVDTTKLKDRARMQLMKKFGMLFQNGALFDSMTIWENVAFGLLEQGMKPAKAREIAIQKLALVGLDDKVAALSPAELSGGMKKRAALARAICLEPEIIFYDEPTTGLDPITSDVINSLILKLQKQLGITSVVITHDMHSAYKVGNTLAMLYQGRFIAQGTPAEIQKSDNPYVKQFINGEAEGPIKMAVRRD